jgi:hypothetical protein
MKKIQAAALKIYMHAVCQQFGLPTQAAFQHNICPGMVAMLASVTPVN